MFSSAHSSFRLLLAVPVSIAALSLVNGPAATWAAVPFTVLLSAALLPALLTRAPRVPTTVRPHCEVKR